MFYAQKPSNDLRFGDVVQGFVLTAPTLDDPGAHTVFQIEVTAPLYCVVLSPCCSIGDKVISLTPLIAVRGGFFENPYFVEELTRINRRMQPQQSVSPGRWNSFPLQEQQKRLQEGYGYAVRECFIYAEHELLPRYVVHRASGTLETGFYMVDFRNTCKVSCARIRSASDAPVSTKRMELSLEARSDLREKLAAYYGRKPKEDAVLED